MNICIVGLGLIGGSFAKSIKKNNHHVLAIDVDETVLKAAKECGAVDDTELSKNLSSSGKLGECELVILAVNPDIAISFVRQHADLFATDTVVLDCCGIKRKVCDEIEKIATEKGFVFLGGHPMAGKERSGFSHSTPNLFSKASMILTPCSVLAKEAASKLEPFFKEIGFSKIVYSTPMEHDRIIAYTSQLAHVASNAYIKSPTAQEHRGFSAGSFRDMTRVAYLDEKMWSELFIDNADNLISELDYYIEKLCEYRDALRAADRDRLMELLKDGKEKKKQTL